MNRNLFSILGCCILFSIVSVLAHEFYVSVSSVKFKADENRLIIKVRTFTNDLEDAIVNRGFDRPDLDKETESENSPELIANYITDHFMMKVNGDTANVIFLERYYEADVAWSVLQVTNVAAVKTIEVENKVLMELFDAQTNIVRFDINGEKKYLNLTKQLPNGIVDF